MAESRSDNDLSAILRRDEALARGHAAEPTLTALAISLHGVAARQMRLDNRIAEIFREFDALRVANEQLREHLDVLDAKIDRLLDGAHSHRD